MQYPEDQIVRIRYGATVVLLARNANNGLYPRNCEAAALWMRGIEEDDAGKGEGGGGGGWKGDPDHEPWAA